MKYFRLNVHSNMIFPVDISVESIGTHLYKVGFTNYKFNEEKRSLFYNPLLVFTIISLMSLRFITSLLITKADRQFFLKIGDFSYIVGVRYHYNLFMLQIFLCTLLSQLIHHYNYRHNIRPYI